MSQNQKQYPERSPQETRAFWDGYSLAMHDVRFALQKVKAGALNLDVLLTKIEARRYGRLQKSLEEAK